MSVHYQAVNWNRQKKLYDATALGSMALYLAMFIGLGAEPWGRIGSGVMELIASMLLLWPRTSAVGAALSLGIISGAIMSHLTKLGITIPAVGDYGELFTLAAVVFIASATVLLLHRRKLPVVGAFL